MNTPIDLKAPEMEALKNYLDAVSEALATSNATEDDIQQIKDDICAHVIHQIETTSDQEVSISAIVRELDSPENYRDAEPDEINSTTLLKEKGKPIRPWMVATGTLVLGGIILLTIAIICSAIFISKRNQFVIADKEIDQTQAQVQVVLQRRYDLIPNLIETVKGYAKHESEVLQEVIKLRSQWDQSESAEEKRAISIRLEPQLVKVMALAEQYPDLKASQNFLVLQTQLESSENRISIERRRMNLALQQYNALIELFPGNIVALTLGYEPRETYFEALPDAQAAPKVQF